MATVVENALVKSTSLGFHMGVMSLWLHLDYDGSGQSFGGWRLTDVGDIKSILDTVGVSKWEDLPGHTVRSRHDDNGVHAIGHFLKDKWWGPAWREERGGGRWVSASTGDNLR